MRSLLLVLLCLVPRETILRTSWAPPSQLDPQRATSVAESRYITAMFEGLVVPGPDGVTPTPGMAERWEISADGLDWTFHLREAVWSNGDPVTSSDFTFAWRRALRAETGCVFGGTWTR